MILQYKNNRFATISDILDQYSPAEFDSPYRSTILLLQYWWETEKRLSEFLRFLDFDVRPKALNFEHCVMPAMGKARQSQTDLMIIADQYAIGIEAKYTEPAYQRVEQWMGTSSNRAVVLESWLSLIKSVQQKDELRIQDVLDLPYQMIHRCASVCAEKVENRVMLYQCFALDEKKEDYYTRQLESLMKRLNVQSNFRIMLISWDLVKSESYQQIQSLWNSGSRKLHHEVILILKCNDVCKFGEPKVLFDNGRISSRE